MREDGIRIGLRYHNYESAVEVVTDRDGNEFSLWMLIFSGDEEEGEGGEAIAVELSPEEARTLAGTLDRMAGDLGRHIEWKGLSGNQ